jgi:putative phage-type endonuclease
MIRKFPTRDEWLAARQDYITSTEVPALFGASPYLTPFELYAAKRGTLDKTFESTERMRWGLRLEEAIAHAAAERHGLTGLQSLHLQLAVSGCLAASGDYLASDGDILIECKNVDAMQFRRNWDAEDGVILSAPAHIELQIQTELACWDAKRLLLAVLVGGNELYTAWREPIAPMIERIRREAGLFMARVQVGDAPDPVYPGDAAAVIAANAYAEPGRLLEAHGDTDLDALVREYRRISREARDLDDLAKSIKAQILDRIGDAERVLGAGWTISASMVAPTPPTTITAEMVGQTYGGRAGYRALRVTEKKA